MKHIYAHLMLAAMLGSASVQANTGTTFNKTLQHGEIAREYTLYVPSVYSTETPAPVVFCFHRATNVPAESNASTFMERTQLAHIADTAGFILVSPQGLSNAGGYLGLAIFEDPEFWADNDKNFIYALIDSIANDYSIDSNRIYATGMQFGATFAYYTVLEMGDRFAAVAPVSGSMPIEPLVSYEHDHPTPILAIYGTNDLIPYNDLQLRLSISNTVQFWVNSNNCNRTPVVHNIPDINTSDGTTVQHYIHSDCDKDANVEYMLIQDGQHYWPGNPNEQGNMDISAAAEIWKFVSRYRLDSLRAAPEPLILLDPIQDNRVQVYPNPAQSHLHITTNSTLPIEYKIYSSLGLLVMQGVAEPNHATINLQPLENGSYLLVTDKQIFNIVKVE